MFKLVIQDDEGKTTVVPLIRDEITIGRKEGNTIRLTERNVSRRHARILRNNGEVQIEDLGSYNGIRVNNARIAERVSLRVSDQVQIGDYKLYLKAEGVEQVDDARTMPIERIDTTTTEVMTAVAANPTAPMAAQTGATGPVPQIRAVAATADTDPAGRPVATAPQVAALTALAGYGKLAIVSSNFAGKEFDLTRAQMIIGRTDENDLVINHRSISRNHAKITRDPNSGRYTISDLQSSNGVRVNGQDYGKVELRRGDIVDLGHVRLQFVEPGQDFVFARDAVIGDVPETGGKRGLLVGVILAIVTLGAVGSFLMLGNKGEKKRGGDNGSSLANGSNAILTNGSGSSNNGEPGSNGSQDVAIQAPADAAAVAANDEVGRIKAECQKFIDAKKWSDVQRCADPLLKLDSDAYRQLKETARLESKNGNEFENLKDALNKDKSLPHARTLLDNIPAESVYKKLAQNEYDVARQKVISQLRLDANKHRHDCSWLDEQLKQAKSTHGADVADAIHVKCELTATVTPPPPPAVDCSALTSANDKKCHQQFCAAHDKDPRCAPATVVVPNTSCDADDLRSKGVAAQEIGQFSMAFRMFSESVNCKPNAAAASMTLAVLAACRMHDLQKAKIYWGKLGDGGQSRVIQTCIGNGLTKDQLDGK